jgi:outer membrane protein OmpA-like peptidoglycan-associated protein
MRRGISMQRLAAAVLVLLCAPALAQKMPADAPDSKDHPILSRYEGSWLFASESSDFDEVSFPSGPRNEDKIAVQGRATRLLYLGPNGRSALEVQSNYEQALERAGATRRAACAAQTCNAYKFQPLRPEFLKLKLAKEPFEGMRPGTLVDLLYDNNAARYWYGTLNVSGTTLHVAVLTGPSQAAKLANRHTGTLIVIVEPKAMDTRKVAVDANALARGLKAEGKIALYGLFFDTGKSDIKPESTPQLDEMARLLQAEAALRVFIVGHTDNQGAHDTNVVLSRARAQSVADALAKNYRIDAKRLTAVGVANYAPVASNADDSGRARNRRVELVVQ